MMIEAMLNDDELNDDLLIVSNTDFQMHLFLTTVRQQNNRLLPVENRLNLYIVRMVSIWVPFHS